ncbi:MAG: 3'-5' exonuclease [Bdellovibrio sp.]|nr:MAG: 3'-5' exonuclease [Bdellovibrio sp.]
MRYRFCLWERQDTLHGMTLWKDMTLVAFDLETTGKYPLGAEICELAAVKWQAGKRMGTFQSLVRPRQKMSDEVIAIHHISNEMVLKAPPIEEVIGDFYQFLKGAYLVAHHAPFDMGFLAVEFEKAGLNLHDKTLFPPVFCSSLLTRKTFPEFPNHKLQTLTQKLNVSVQQAHRALDDSQACLEVTLKTFKVLGEKKDKQMVEELLAFQKENLVWERFSIKSLGSWAENVKKVIASGEAMELVYQGGSRPGQARKVWPVGLVRTPLKQGDFLVAKDEKGVIKRYFLSKIQK